MKGTRELRAGVTLAAALAAGGVAILLGPHLGLAGAAGTLPATGTARSASDVKQPRQARAVAAKPALAPSRHVFIIALGQGSEATTFPADGTAPAPYLDGTLTAAGALLPNFYAVGHDETDDYIAMVSGQAPNPDTQSNCTIYAPFTTDATSGPYDQQQGDGCIYPTDIPSIATQLDSAGFSWRDYDQSMGDDPTREPNECGHPPVGGDDNTQIATTTDAYAADHNPFVYFNAIIANTTLCATHVVNLDALPLDLASAATTPNYVFITPDLCGDGGDPGDLGDASAASDSTCAENGRLDGYAGINAFLAQYVPMILASPAYKQGNGLLLVTFDQSIDTDTSSCCGEIPGPGAASPGLTGAGGGQVGAVAISPCIRGGTVDDTDYDDYSLLGSVENIFGLKHLGYANLPGQSYFGADLYTRKCNTPPKLTVKTPTVSATTTTATPVVQLRFSSNQAGGTFTLEVRRTSGARESAWESLLNAETDSDTSYSFKGASGQTYEFKLAAVNGAGVTSAAKTVTVLVPTHAVPVGARLTGRWRYVTAAGSWRGHTEVGYAHATYTYTYTGRGLKLLATRDRAGGHITVTFNGRPHRVSLHTRAWHADQTVLSLTAGAGRHTVKITVDSGVAALDGLQITDLR